MNQARVIMSSSYRSQLSAHIPSEGPGERRGGEFDQAGRGVAAAGPSDSARVQGSLEEKKGRERGKEREEGKKKHMYIHYPTVPEQG